MGDPGLRQAWLDELLLCPTCGSDLSVEDAASLTCSSGHTVPVVRGIPRFTAPSSYADSFGFEWTEFPRLQLDDESGTESEETFRTKTGLTAEDVRGRTVLDAGCGMGRFTDVVARWGAERVVGADISRAADAAGQNLAGMANAAVIQADLRELPLRAASFDVVFSMGVLHHTPSTLQSLRRIARFVKPGGIFAIWVYSRRLRWTLLGGEILRPATNRMPPERLLRAIKAVVPRVSAIKDAVPAAAAPLDFLLPTSNHPDPEWQILDTFDWYSPRYQWKHTYPEVEAWFRRLGLVDVRRLEVPVSVRGRRPAHPQEAESSTSME